MMERMFSHGRHPISSTAFEVFHNGYWRWTDHFSIVDGFIYVNHAIEEYVIKERINRQDIRLKSRKAESVDCKILRPGRDICVAVGSENKQPVFHDAKISSVISNSHGSNCTCIFSVNIYQRKSDNDTLALILKNVAAEVNIDKISILQTIHTEYSKCGYRHWYASKDRFSLKQSKLLASIFGSEVIWLLVLSVLKKICIDVRFVKDRIIYSTLDKPGQNIEEVDADFTEKNKVITILTVDKKKVVKIESADREFSQSSPHSKTLDTRSGNSSCELGGEDSTSNFGLRRSARLRNSPVCFTAFFANRVSRKHLTKLSSCEANKDGDVSELWPDPDPKTSNEDETLHVDFLRDICTRNIRPKSEHKTSHHKNEKATIKSVKYHLNDSQSQENEGYAYASERSPLSKRKRSTVASLSDKEYKIMMRNCMGNIQTIMQKHAGICSSRIQWDTLHFKWDTAEVSSFQEREYETLWREMDYTVWLEEEERNIQCPKRRRHCSEGHTDDGCKHEIFLDEEFGIACRICESLISERRYVFPSFADNCVKVRHIRNELEQMDPLLNSFCSDDIKPPFPNHISISRKQPVWGIIPELKTKLYFHQRKAVEFLWKNIADPLLSNQVNYNESAGCIISHSPGSGKTFLVVSFLLSCLKGFSGLRPLILAPKTALSVWIREFKKWKVSFPLHHLLPIGDYRKDLNLHHEDISLVNGRKLSLKTRHMLYCIKMLQKWHEQQSILLMSYSSFLSMSNIGRKRNSTDQKAFIAQVLLESTGLLVLDEGHNPRSTKSKLRKLLMDVKTKSRILLSGTLFQNNFEEYFNTLCLARPTFKYDVIEKLKLVDYKFNGKNKKIITKNEEEFSRRIFIEEIGRRFESNTEVERRKGFKMLVEITEQFVDVHDAGIDNLPGLEAYIVILHPSETQENILLWLQHLGKMARTSWEVELLITLACIHPWLITTVSGVTKYFSKEELDEINKLKRDTCKGPKIRFVLDIILRAVNSGEKVLVFCRNIPPITLLLELLEVIFSWKKGEDIFVLQGDLDFSERAMVIDQFGDSKGNSKVLLASTTACSEGISLIAASRVVLLDLEWNHSRTKQAIARAFRHGQERRVYVYQLLAAFEKKKYSLHERKEWLSKIISMGRYAEHASSLVCRSIHDDILKELVEKDHIEIMHMII